MPLWGNTGHEPGREHAVPCARCKRTTFNVSAVCDWHDEDRHERIIAKYRRLSLELVA